MKTTRSADKSRLPKSAVALLVVASVFAASGVIRNVGVASADALPDPDHMALLAVDRESTERLAEIWAARAIEHPDNATFRAQHASALMNLAAATGDLTLYEEAEHLAETAVALDGTNATAKLTHAASLSGQHDFIGALAIIETVVATDETSEAALLALGDVHVELGNYREADEAYLRATAALGGTPPALISRLARLESLRADSPRSLEMSRSALQGAGDIDLPLADAAFYWSQLAHYSFLTGDLPGAESALRSALVVDPENPGATELLAKVLAARGKDAEAIATYQALQSGGTAADLHGELAKLYRRAGRDRDADREIASGLELAREQADRFPAERRHLIGFLADHDPARAVRLAELDLADRNDVLTHSWYAWTLLQNGEPQAALAALAPALALGTDDPLLLYQAGAIHAANDNTALAETYLTKALETNPTFDVEHAVRARVLLDDVQGE